MSGLPQIPVIRINDEPLGELSRSPSAIDRHRTPHPNPEWTPSTTRRTRSPSPRRRRNGAAPSPAAIPQLPVLLKMNPQIFHDRVSSGKSIQLLSVDIVVVYMSLYNDQSAELNPFQHINRQATRINTFIREAPRANNVKRAKSLDNTKTDTDNSAPHTTPTVPSGSAATMVEKVPQPLSKDQVNWLKDRNMLPGGIPGARILGIEFKVPPKGPNFKIDLNSAAEEMIGYMKRNREDLPTSPIIFIGHGCGCFVIEEATATRGDEFLDSTAGMIFFGKPSDEKVNQKTQAPGILNEFKNIGPELKVTTDTFKHGVQAAGIPFISFSGMENLPDDQKTDFKAEMPRFDSVIKSSRSPPDLPFPLPLDFQNGINFSGPKDAIFKLVSDCILHFMDIWKFLDAACRDDEKVLLYFIVNGVDPNTKDKHLETALHKAVKHSNLEMIRTLLENGADINMPDQSGMTALHHAAERNQSRIVQFLLQKGATASSINKRRKTAADIAEEGGFQDLAEQLRRPPLIEGPLHDSDDETPQTIKLPKKGSQASREFMMTASELFLVNGRENHFSVRQSVNYMVYGGEKLEDILRHHREDAGSAQLTCRWYHFPVNNMVWIEDLFEKLGFPNEPRWSGYRHDSDIPHSRNITPHATNRTIKSAGTRYFLRSIFVPYVSYERKSRQMQRSKFIRHVHQENLGKFGRARDPRSVENKDLLDPDELLISLSKDELYLGKSNLGHALNVEEADAEFDLIEKSEKTLIREFLYHPTPFHVRRTLDQYYYYMLPNTEDRDDDQVISRWFKDTKKRDHKLQRCLFNEYFHEPNVSYIHSAFDRYQEFESIDEITEQEELIEEPEHNILMVDQLWLWVIEPVEGDRPAIVISSFPDRNGLESEDFDDIQAAVLRRLKKKSRKPVTNTTQLVSRIIATCLGIFDRSQESDMVQFSQYFESSIGRVGNKEIKLFNEFRESLEQIHFLSGLTQKHKIKFKSYRDKYLDRLQNIVQETRLLAEVKDIADEIRIIMTVLQAQKSVMENTDLSGNHNSASWEEVEEAINSSIAEFQVMKAHAEEIHVSLSNLLDLKQKQANVSEARSARERAQETAKQGNVIMIFTVFTVIFLPLSFMASFFALNITQFPTDSRSGEPHWPLSLVSAFIFGISFSLSLPVVAIALNVDRISNLWHRYLWATRIPSDVKSRVLRDHKLSSDLRSMDSSLEPSVSGASESFSYREEGYSNYSSDAETLIKQSSMRRRSFRGVSALKTLTVGINSSRNNEDPEIGAT
ncbi:hypothetical protein FQN54_008403 [Arachnomyces sp. PD_36]|nr:hypothetical protein FQN54_008403 [Arachnomyces sp. PD_36]